MYKFIKSKAKFAAMIAIISALVIPLCSNAQFVTRTGKDSVVNGVTKYVTFNSTADGVIGFQLSASKVSGTVSAYAILEVRIDTVISGQYQQEKLRDTFALTDQASQIFLWKVAPHYFNGARIKIVSTGTQKFYIYAAYLRRNNP